MNTDKSDRYMVTGRRERWREGRHRVSKMAEPRQGVNKTKHNITPDLFFLSLVGRAAGSSRPPSCQSKLTSSLTNILLNIPLVIRYPEKINSQILSFFKFLSKFPASLQGFVMRTLGHGCFLT